MITPLHDINKSMRELIGLPDLYEVKIGASHVADHLTLAEAEVCLSNVNDKDAFIMLSRNNILYDSNLEETVKAISKLAQKDNHTFVLSFEDGQWRAAYGDYKDCEEYRGANPAYCSCMALLKFMGKIQ